jgi:uncharacterized protein (TIGR02145 family)
MKFGSSLYLPAAGTRGYNTGTLHSRGSSGDYWTTRGSSGAYAYYFYFDKFGTGMNTYNRRHGLPVRCIVE